MPKSFTFNGMSSENFNIIVDQPIVSFAKRKVYSSSVTGMNGNYYDFQNAWEEKIIAYKILAGNNTSTNYQIFIQIAEWLNDTNGYAILTDSFDPEHYHLAVCIDGMDAVMALQHYGKATIRFRCKPERYLITESIEVTSGDSIDNPTNHNAYPLITLTGGGVRNLLKLEGHTLSSAQYEWYTSALSGQVAVKDTTAWLVDTQTRLPVRLAGSVDGTINTLDDSNGIIEYTPINAKNFWGVGLVKEVKPNSNYVISCEFKKLSSAAYGIIMVHFLGSTGNNTPISSAKAQVVISQSYQPVSLPFTTPSECGYVLISFANSENSTTKREIRNIMLNNGTEAQTFRAFANPSVSALTINGITASITSSGFNTAVIDCEKENVTIDGVNGNPNTTLTDQYGNLSISYLQMIEGTNAITYSGDITAVSVEPRFWEL